MFLPFTKDITASLLPLLLTPFTPYSLYSQYNHLSFNFF